MKNKIIFTCSTLQLQKTQYNPFRGRQKLESCKDQHPGFILKLHDQFTQSNSSPYLEINIYKKETDTEGQCMRADGGGAVLKKVMDFTSHEPNPQPGKFKQPLMLCTIGFMLNCLRELENNARIVQLN